MSNLQLGVITIAILVCVATSPSSMAGRGVIVDAEGMLWDVDLTSGQYSNPRQTSVPGCTGCLALGGHGAGLETDSSGMLYGISHHALYSVDDQTGVTDFIGSLRYSDFYPGGIAWDPTTERMFTTYISLVGGWVRALLEVDLTSGQLQLLTGIRIHKGGISALGIDDAGELFALSSTYKDGVGVIDSVSQVDKSNGEFLWSRSLSQNISVGGQASMDFDPDTNQMYVAATPGFGIPPSLYTINVQTGNVIKIGSGAEFIYPMSLVILPGTPLPGDYNNDGLVNLADYTLWRNTLGATGAGLAADGNGDLVIDAADHNVWKINFGQSTAGTAKATSAVPEPGSALQWCVLTLVLVGVNTLPRR